MRQPIPRWWKDDSDLDAVEITTNLICGMRPRDVEREFPEIDEVNEFSEAELGDHLAAEERLRAMMEQPAAPSVPTDGKNAVTEAPNTREPKNPLGDA